MFLTQVVFHSAHGEYKISEWEFLGKLFPCKKSKCTRNYTIKHKPSLGKKTHTQTPISKWQNVSYIPLTHIHNTFMSPHYWSHSEFMTYYSVSREKSEVLTLKHKSISPQPPLPKSRLTSCYANEWIRPACITGNRLFKFKEVLFYFIHSGIHYSPYS